MAREGKKRQNKTRQGKRYSKARKNVTHGIKEIPHVIRFQTRNAFITSGSCV